MNDWERQSSSYRRGWIAAEQGEYDFAQLLANAPYQAEALQGWADGCQWNKNNGVNHGDTSSRGRDDHDQG